MLKRIRAGVRWLLDWHVRRTLRRHGLPDIPEVRRLLRAAWRKGFTSGAAPNQRRMRAIREQALAAAIGGGIQSPWPVPLPAPEKLAEYDKGAPGAAERILSAAERTLASTIEIVDKLANAEIETAKTGLSVAFGLTFLGFAASVASFAMRHQVAGVALVASPVLTLLRSLLGRRRLNIGGHGQ